MADVERALKAMPPPGAATDTDADADGARNNILALTDAAGWAPVHVAAHRGREDVLRVLVAAGAATDVTTLDGCTPAVLAARQGHTAAVQLLLNATRARAGAGATPGSVGSPALQETMWACAFLTAPGTLQAVLDAGADPAGPDAAGRMALHVACHMGCAPAAATLAAALRRAGKPLHAVDATGATPLHIACFRGDLALVKVLLDAGAAPDEVVGVVPLAVAAQHGHTSLVQHLVRRGARVDARAVQPPGPSALFLAVQVRVCVCACVRVCVCACVRVCVCDVRRA